MRIQCIDDLKQEHVGRYIALWDSSNTDSVECGVYLEPAGDTVTDALFHEGASIYECVREIWENADTFGETEVVIGKVINIDGEVDVEVIHEVDLTDDDPRSNLR